MVATQSRSQASGQKSDGDDLLLNRSAAVRLFHCLPASSGSRAVAIGRALKYYRLKPMVLQCGTIPYCKVRTSTRRVATPRRFEPPVPEIRRGSRHYRRAGKGDRTTAWRIGCAAGGLARIHLVQCVARARLLHCDCHQLGMGTGSMLKRSTPRRFRACHAVPMRSIETSRPVP